MATVQMVIGPPGSGKSTYCRGMKQFLSTLGRSVEIVNLDPANDSLPYDSPPAVDITELITLEEVMDRMHLGPNGGLMYCMEYLERNCDWLLSKLNNSSQFYYLIDCPGQVELYTHHSAIKTVTSKLQQANMKVVSVHLVDSQHCNDPGKFISVLLTSLASMLQMETPHVNVLSKMDLLQRYDQLAFGVDYYTDVLDLSHLLYLLSDDPFLCRYKALNKALIGLVEDYSLVSFVPLSIEDKASVHEVSKAIDKASGYIVSQNERDTLSQLLSTAYSADYQYSKNMTIREKIGKSKRNDT